MIEKDLLERVYFDVFEGEKTEGFKIGFNDLDDILSNVPKGSLITIGGRPAIGKTTLITSIIENIVKSGKRILLISLKDSRIKITTKFLKQFAEIKYPINNIRYLKADEAIKLTEVFNDLFSYDICIDDSANTIDKIEETIKDIKADYIFIDDLQSIKTNDNKFRIEEMNRIVLRFKEIAKEYDAYIILSSQLSRNVEKRNSHYPSLCDIKETDNLEYVSDLILFLYREDYYNLEDTENRNNAEICIAKNNYGANCSINLIFEPSIPKFYSKENINVF